MKKIFILGAALVLMASCADLSKYTAVDSNASAKTRMRACMVSEANAKFQAGTLLTKGISATADEIVNTCIKKLALQSAGISEESQSTAESIITNLKNMATPIKFLSETSKTALSADNAVFVLKGGGNTIFLFPFSHCRSELPSFIFIDIYNENTIL